ncbi:MAG: type 4a pilus biogenesis protein PilO [Deltaproteobacteria bacterium]|nr:type 4a pilus biogenesis protein PilO [Deltaproteobacteria bacterium]
MAPKININLDVVMKLPLNKRVGILAGANAVLAALIAWFLTWPAYSQGAVHRVQLADLSNKLVKDRRIAADIPKYLREKKEMEDSLVKALTQLPNDKEIPDLIDSIATSAQRAGFKILLFKPEKEAPKGFYAEVPVTMKVEGKFESLYDFTNKVGGLPRIVNIGAMNIDSAGHNARHVPMLKADFVATTFRFIPVQEEADKAAGAKAAANAPKEEGKK